MFFHMWSWTRTLEAFSRLEEFKRTASIASDNTKTTIITYNWEITGSEGAEKVSRRENEKLVACISSTKKHLVSAESVAFANTPNTATQSGGS